MMALERLLQRQSDLYGESEQVINNIPNMWICAVIMSQVKAEVQ